MRLSILLFFVLTACRSLPAGVGKGVIRFQHTFRGEPFLLDKPYITLLGDTVVFTKFKYYVNFTEMGGGIGLIEAGETSTATSIPLKNLPKNASNISFGIGIDSLNNTKGKQKDALDPLNGMFWTWEQGYAFLKAEGFFSPNSPNRVSFVLHMGGNQHYQILAYPQHTKEINIALEKLFGGFEGASIDLIKTTKPLSLMAGEKIKLLQKNIQAMFSPISTEN